MVDWNFTSLIPKAGQNQRWICQSSMNERNRNGWFVVPMKEKIKQFFFWEFTNQTTTVNVIFNRQREFQWMRTLEIWEFMVNELGILRVSSDSRKVFRSFVKFQHDIIYIEYGARYGRSLWFSLKLLVFPCIFMESHLVSPNLWIISSYVCVVTCIVL